LIGLVVAAALIDFEPDETVPLQIGRFLGRGATGDVHEATCQGLSVALKRKYSRSRASQVFGQELDILGRLGDHDHIVKIVGSFTYSQVMGILLSPIAVCDLRTFLEDVDPL
jgi:serine/threonine protein kinase